MDFIATQHEKCSCKRNVIERSKYIRKRILESSARLIIVITTIKHCLETEKGKGKRSLRNAA